MSNFCCFRPPTTSQFFIGATAAPPCDCPRTTMWRTKSSTAQLSSPPLDTPLTAGTSHTSIFSFSLSDDKSLEREKWKRKALSISLWSHDFFALKPLTTLSTDERRTFELRSNLRDYPYPFFFSCSFTPSLNPFFAWSTLAASLSACCIIQQHLL